MNSRIEVDNNLTIKDLFRKLPKVNQKKQYYRLKDFADSATAFFLIEYLSIEDHDQRSIQIQQGISSSVNSFLTDAFRQKEKIKKENPDAEVHLRPSTKGVEILASKTKKIAYIDSNLLDMLSRTMPPKNYTINNFFCPEVLILLPKDNNQNIVGVYFSVTENVLEYYIYPSATIADPTPPARGSEIGYISLGLPVDEGLSYTAIDGNNNVIDTPYTLDSSIDLCDNWIVNFLLWQQSEWDKNQDIVELDAPTRKMGFGKNSKQIIVPKVIGEGYKPKIIRNYESTGTHASPRTHWRSGHWRQQPYGKKDDPKLKTIWLEPVLVNG